MRVAAVVPAYRAEDTLEAAIASVRAQTRAPDEVVVVDDGSPDGTAEVAGRLGVTCLRQDNAGPGAARNRGVRATSAEWIAFLDADDRWLPRYLERMAVVLEGAPEVAGACAGAFDVVGGARRRHGAGREMPARLGVGELLRGNPVVCSAVVLGRAAFERAGGFDEDPGQIATEDLDLWLRVAAEAPLLFVDEPLVEYRHGPGGVGRAERFLRGIDRIVGKIGERHAGDAGLCERAVLLRARARMDRAWELAREGRGASARRMLWAARRDGARGRGWWRRWLRTFLPAR